MNLFPDITSVSRDFRESDYIISRIYSLFRKRKRERERLVGIFHETNG